MKSLLLIGFVVSFTSHGNGSEEKTALRTAMRAFYKQSGMERDVNKFVKEEVPKDLQMVVGNAVYITKVIQEKQITVTWSF